MPKTKVFAVRPDRLGGRLSAIVNAKRLADMFDLDLQVFWSKPKHAYPELVTPEDVFSEAFIADHFLPANTPKGALEFTPIPKKSIPCDRAKFAAQIADDDVGFVTREGAVVLPFEDEHAARAGFAETFRSLDFSPAFRDTMDHIDTVVSGDCEHIAVHIRRGDVIRNENTSEGFWHGQYVPDAIYFQALNRLASKSVRFVFFCDDAEVLATYLARYQGGVAASELTQASGKPALHVDLAEMYLMSRCNRILGPRNSAYSTTAADLSGAICEPVEDLLNPAQMRRAVTKLAQDITTGVEAFHSVGDFKQSINALMNFHTHLRPKISVIDVAKLGHTHGIATPNLLESALKHAVATQDFDAVPMLEQMTREYPVRHVSALGESFAALAYAHVIQGNTVQGLRHLGWANWFYPESPFVSYLSSALIGADGVDLPCLGLDRYARYKARSLMPMQKGLRLLVGGPFASKINRIGHMKNHFAPFMVMDWLEFVNPKSRARLQMQSSLPRDLLAKIPDDFAPYDAAMRTGSPEAIASLQKRAQTLDPMDLKRLASAYFRNRAHDQGLEVMREAFENSEGNAVYLAALGVRLLEFGRHQEAVDTFDKLDAPWALENPSVTFAHAQALFGIKEFPKSAEIIQRNLDFANPCNLSGKLKRQLQQYF
jgi:tetratricopeptide (TPR) repeat protein